MDLIGTNFQKIYSIFTEKIRYLWESGLYSRQIFIYSSKLSRLLVQDRDTEIPQIFFLYLFTVLADIQIYKY